MLVPISLSATNTPGHHGHIKETQDHSESREKADGPGALASEKGQDGEVPGFSFSLIYPRLAAEPADNPKMTMGPERESPSKTHGTR